MKRSRQRADHKPTPAPAQPRAKPSRQALESYWIPLSLAMAFLVYLGIGLGFPWHFDTTPNLAIFIPYYFRDVRPEPQERFLFLLGLACIPTLPMVCFWWLTCVGQDCAFSDLAERWRRAGVVRDVVVFGSLAIWLVFLFGLTDAGEVALYLGAVIVLALVAPLANALA